MITEVLKILCRETKNDERGQSLIEILIALAIGAMIIGAATIGISFMLRSTSTNQNLQSAAGFMDDLVSKVRSLGGASWANIYSLSKGTSVTYYLAPSSTLLFAVQGREGLFDNDVTNGLVGKWGFDEATGTIAYDGSGNNNNGTLMNNPTRATSTCEAGDCLSLNGTNNFVTINDPPSGILDPTSAYSISFWMKSTSTATYAFIVSKSNGGAGGGYEMFLLGDGRMRFSSCDISGSCSGGYFDVSTPLPYNDGNWHFVTGTVMTGSTASIYVDGVSVVQSGTVTQNNIVNAYPLLIGGRGTSGGTPFGGILDDVRIYNRALSADEVKQLYSGHPFSRYFSVEDACRTNDASSTISGTVSCSPGSLVDPSTEKITTIVEWPTSGNLGSIQTYDYVTRWQNDVFSQNDWSGGSGQDGPYTNPGSVYSTSSNVDAGGQGQIRIHGL